MKSTDKTKVLIQLPDFGNVEAVAKVAAQVALVRIALIGGEFRFTGKVPPTVALASFHSAKHEASGSEFSAIVSMGVSGIAGLPPKDGTAEMPPEILQVAAQFEVGFVTVKGSAPLSDDEIKAFCALNPLFNCWPYAREFLASTTGRFGIPPLELPLFRMPAPVEIQKLQAPDPSPEASTS